MQGPLHSKDLVVVLNNRDGSYIEEIASLSRNSCGRHKVFLAWNEVGWHWTRYKNLKQIMVKFNDVQAGIYDFYPNNLPMKFY